MLMAFQIRLTQDYEVLFRTQDKMT